MAFAAVLWGADPVHSILRADVLPATGVRSVAVCTLSEAPLRKEDDTLPVCVGGIRAGRHVDPISRLAIWFVAVASPSAAFHSFDNSEVYPLDCARLGQDYLRREDILQAEPASACAAA